MSDEIIKDEFLDVNSPEILSAEARIDRLEARIENLQAMKIMKKKIDTDEITLEILISREKNLDEDIFQELLLCCIQRQWINKTKKLIDNDEVTVRDLADKQEELTQPVFDELVIHLALKTGCETTAVYAEITRVRIECSSMSLKQLLAIENKLTPDDFCIFWDSISKQKVDQLESNVHDMLMGMIEEQEEGEQNTDAPFADTPSWYAELEGFGADHAIKAECCNNLSLQTPEKRKESEANAYNAYLLHRLGNRGEGI